MRALAGIAGQVHTEVCPVHWLHTARDRHVHQEGHDCGKVQGWAVDTIRVIRRLKEAHRQWGLEEDHSLG
eukprot:3451922-Amphidinium_carterae.1